MRVIYHGRGKLLVVVEVGGGGAGMRVGGMLRGLCGYWCGGRGGGLVD